ncbi:MAG: WD40 repeat domain-containing serine/threonine protein kinase, partial [Planctomycetia bacterium]
RHRNIVRVLDAVVATEGVAIVMEVVRGPSLAQWLKDAGGKAPVRLGAEIVRRAAEAVGEAHRSKLLHRDVKPGNILLEPISAGEPTLDEAALLDETVGPARFGVVDEFDADFPYEPLLADFGLARPVEIDGETLSAMVGTPKYMAPEQLDPDRAKPLTYAVDVYALGMVLYVLVAGKPPFDETSPTKITSRKQRGDLPSLRRGRPHVPADLAAICAACLEYDPARRPTDGRALAELLRAFLAGETVPVRRVGPLEQAARWVRRNPWPTALYATALAGALLVAGTTVHYNRRLVDAAGSLDKTNRSLVAALDKANTLNYASQMQRAALAWNDRADPNAALEVLETLRPTAGATAADGLPLDPTDRRGFEWHFLHAAVRGDAEQLNTSHGQALDVEYSPDDRLVATTGDDATVCLWDANDKRLMRRLVGASHKLRTVAWSGDGSRIAASGHGPGVYVWTVADGALRQSIDTDFDPVIALTFHPKEDVLLVGEQQARGAEHGVINAYRPSDGRL